MIGDGDCGLAISFDLPDERVDLVGPVEETVLSVQMQVNEG